MTQMLQETKPLNLAWMTGSCGAVGLFGIILVSNPDINVGASG